MTASQRERQRVRAASASASSAPAGSARCSAPRSPAPATRSSASPRCRQRAATAPRRCCRACRFSTCPTSSSAASSSSSRCPRPSSRPSSPASPRPAPGSRASSCCTRPPGFGTGGARARARGRARSRSPCIRRMAFTGTSIDLARLRETLLRRHRADPGAADRAGARRRDGRRAGRRRRGRPRRLRGGHRDRHAASRPRSSARPPACCAASASSARARVLAPLVRSAVENALAAPTRLPIRSISPDRARRTESHVTRPSRSIDASRCVVETIAALREARAAGRSVALVPTMGALHDGHLALVDRARELGRHRRRVDLREPAAVRRRAKTSTSYPRTSTPTSTALAAHGVAFVFAPTVDEMYPDGADRRSRVDRRPGRPTLFEGASRPGHFDGMLTVVAKLLDIVRPDIVVFGQKDAQQVFLVQRMVPTSTCPSRSRSSRPCGRTTGSRSRAATATSTTTQRRAALALSAGRCEAARIRRRPRHRRRARRRAVACSWTSRSLSWTTSWS